MGDDTPPIEVVEGMVLKDKKKSYQIEEDEFALNEVDYDQVSWTYYQYDDVVLDFFDMPVDYEDEFIEGAKDVLDKMDDDSDRKSTRLNSSHVASSYAVCCWE